MNTFLKVLACLIILLSCNKSTKIQYPTTKKIVITDRYFETKIKDPYRWMEDDQSNKIQKYLDLLLEIFINFLF